MYLSQWQLSFISDKHSIQKTGREKWLKYTDSNYIKSNQKFYLKFVHLQTMSWDLCEDNFS